MLFECFDQKSVFDDNDVRLWGCVCRAVSCFRRNDKEDIISQRHYAGWLLPTMSRYRGTLRKRKNIVAGNYREVKVRNEPWQ